MQDMNDVVEVEMMLAGPPGTGITAAEKANIDARLIAVEGMAFGDLSDVDTTTVVDGNTIVYSGGAWAPGSVAGSLSEVYDKTDTLVVTDATRLTAKSGVTARVGLTDPNWAVIEADIGTGAGQVAAGDHLHPLPAVQRYDMPNPGSLATIYSGTPTLITASVGTFAVNVPTLVEVDAHIDAEGVDDPARCNIIITIDGTTYSSAAVPRTDPFTWEWGVNGERSWQAAKTITRAAGQPGSRTITLAVQWIEWGGLNVKSAWMWVRRTAYRS